MAVGAHLKNSIALSVGNQIFISQHIGDLETEPANNAFRRVIADFEKLYDSKPEIVIADSHPDYLSTKFANESEIRKNTLASSITSRMFCRAWRKMKPHCQRLAFAWDGTGYGLDGTIWGGEFFLVTKNSCERVVHLRPFRLPGGDKAVKEPRRAATRLAL